MLRTLAAFGVGLVGVFAGPVVAQPAEQKPFVEVRFAGIDGIEFSEKDRAAVEALRLAGERLSELPGELDGEEEAGPLVRQAWYALMGGMGLEIVPKAGPPGVALAMTADPAQPGSAWELLRIVSEIAEMEGAPVEVAEGRVTMPTPMGPVVVTADDVMSLRFGTEEAASMEVSTSMLPAGSDGVLSFRADLASINAMVGPMLAMQGPEAAAALAMTGWVGPEAPTSLEFEVGLSDTHMVWASKMENARMAMPKWGLTPDESIGRRELEMIPQDATRVLAMGFGLSGMLGMFDNMIEQMGEDEDPWAEIKEQTGIDLRQDVLENVGPRVVFYQSESTGGGGLISSVLLMELKDAGAFASAHNQAVEMLNAIAAEEANGYVRVRAWELDGNSVFTLTMPGIPFPLELSWTVHEDMLVAAVSPVGLSAALGQLEAPRGSILRNEKFQSAIGSKFPREGVVAVVYSDAERFARQGYGPMNLVLSGLANGVRSPVDPERQVGVLMPSYREFASGIQPYGGVTTMEGDDLVSQGSGDRSMLVHAAGTLATFGGGQGALAGTALAGGLLMPALGRARESAKQLKSASQVRGVLVGATVYAQNNGDRFPENVEELIDEGMISSEMLESPFGPAWDDNGDIVLMAGIEMDFRFDRIVAMDRAMYINGHDIVNVGFADGHVETMDRWELANALEEPQNEGVREAFGLDDDGPGDW